MSHNEYSQQMAYDKSQQEEGITEWEVEFGDMLNEDDYDDYTCRVECFKDKESAFNRYMELTDENNYDAVDLIERTGVVDGGCQFSDDYAVEETKSELYE